jgi:hypothetical protein
MAHELQHTDDELERLLAEARDKLAGSFREYDEATQHDASERPSQKPAAVNRIQIAKTSVNAWLDMYCRLRDLDERHHPHCDHARH